MASLILRVGLRPCFAQPTTFLRSSTTRARAVSKRNVVHLTGAPHFSAQIAALRHTQRSLPLLLTAAGITGAVLGISSLISPSTLHCDGEYSIWMIFSAESRQCLLQDVPPSQASPSLPHPPNSFVNAHDFTFGTICGFYAGVLVKKVVAYFFRPLLFIFRYLYYASLVDWAAMESRYENLFYTTDAVGNKNPPTTQSIWEWMVNFSTTDFQPSFEAGFALGLRGWLKE